MKNIKMKSGFTMIELIFVIVVLGILASVALPKFVNFQDDAKVSSEKSTIGAVRSAIGMLHGKAIIKNGDFVAKITAGDTANAGVVTTQTLAVTVTDELYPVGLSITDVDGDTAKTGVDTTDANSPSGTALNYVATVKPSDGGTDWVSGTSGNGIATLAVVLSLEGRTSWATGQVEGQTDTGTYSGGTQKPYVSGDAFSKMLIEGPATTATGVKDDQTIDEFEIDSDGTWQYDAIVGTITYRKDDGAGNALTVSSATN